jgi:uncharacterized membrane protein YdbT with pleckstrin-like domain
VAELTAPESKDEQVLFEGNPALFPTITSLLLAILTVGLAALYFMIRQRALHYRITSERIVVESGLFSKHMEQIDIYRINDYTVERPFSQRIMGTGNIVLTAMDRSTPKLELHALKTDVVALYEQLRKATEREKQRRGVRMVDYE